MEYDLLQHIKFCLECKNESQAIRLIEKYGFVKQEKDKNKFSDEEVIDSIQYTIDNFFNGKLAGLNSKEIFEQFKNK